LLFETFAQGRTWRFLRHSCRKATPWDRFSLQQLLRFCFIASAGGACLILGSLPGHPGLLCASKSGGVPRVANPVQESAWHEAPTGLDAPILPQTCWPFLPTFLFLILLMTAFMSFSHGTQDVYPTFPSRSGRSSLRKRSGSSACFTVLLHRGRIRVWIAL